MAAALAIVAGAPASSRGEPVGSEARAEPRKPSRPGPRGPLEGTTYDYAYDGRDVGHPERAWMGRAFIPLKATAAPAPLPILVFIHGMNTEKIKYRWMGGGDEGDIRRMVADLMEAGQVPPMLVAAPSSIIGAAVDDAMTSWPAFDLDNFLERTGVELAGAATIDLGRVIVATHSGGGCNPAGGIASAIRSQHVHTALVIDTCLFPDLATRLAHARPTLNVIVSYTQMTWDSRPFADFRRTFDREVKKVAAPAGVLRVLEEDQPTEPNAHNAMVGLTLRKWLPQLLGVPLLPAKAAQRSP